jgi:hypothetical protein
MPRLNWVKYRLRPEFLRPSIGVRSSFDSGHEINQSAQWRFVPVADMLRCSQSGYRLLRSNGRRYMRPLLLAHRPVPYSLLLAMMASCPASCVRL